MEKTMNNNTVILSGTVTSAFEFSHELYGEKFYQVTMAVKRNSGVMDHIPVMVSDRLLDVKQEYCGKRWKVEGQYRSYNKWEGGKSSLLLFVFAREVELLEEPEEDQPVVDENLIVLSGFLCKKPIYRETPLGREISDLLVAVNRPYGKSDYIPCLVWGRNAKYMAEQEIGVRVQLSGRIQSREYVKCYEDRTEEKRAYEVSVTKLEVLKEHEKEESVSIE
ncbi:MAG: single-stranded DNA-binding protein [Lachnospiraceae bacterium]|nr:single-stranded DNA-binding protein [Lachnospiraceae bacterium]